MVFLRRAEQETTLKRILPLPLFALLLAPAVAQDPAVINPNIVKVEFENDQLRILRVRYHPHERLEMHSHPAKAEVQMTDGSVRIFTPDGKSNDEPGKSGEFFWLEPTRHAVENLEDRELEIIEIEMKKATARSVPISAPSGKTNSVTGKPMPFQEEPHHHWKFENQYVRVFEVMLAPGESTLFHTHSSDKGVASNSVRLWCRSRASEKTGTSRLHNAPFRYVVDKSRVACSDEGTVGEDFPSRTRSSRREAFSFSKDCLFNTHGPQAIGRSAAI